MELVDKIHELREMFAEPKHSVYIRNLKKLNGILSNRQIFILPRNVKRNLITLHPVEELMDKSSNSPIYEFSYELTGEFVISDTTSEIIFPIICSSSDANCDLFKEAYFRMLYILFGFEIWSE